ncbi:MAG: phosphoribosylaminoimidazolesuccinocarboxamide synthase, partial [Cyanobacteria bacterium P01_A01_bin.37]
MSTPPDSEKKLYEGKAKIIYETDQPDILLSWYKDDATAFNAQKRGQIIGKGEINCTMSSHLFQLLESNGIQTHWIDQPSANTMRVHAVTIVPLEVVVRNIAAGSLCRQTGIEVGTVLDPPLVEFYYKNDALGDPLMTRDRILAMGLATTDILNQLETLARRIDDMLT